MDPDPHTSLPTQPLPRPQAGGSRDYWQFREAGLKHLRDGEFDAAVRSLTFAARLEPSLPEALWNLGGALQKAGRFEAARRIYYGLSKLRGAAEDAAAALQSLPPPPPEHPAFVSGQILRSLTTRTVWQIDRVLKGGYGAVCIARDRSDDSKYALKTLQAHYLWSDEDRRRFLREAATWVMLGRYPNIVAAHWIERIEGSLFIVLEYVDGSDLATILERDRTLNLTEGLDLGLQFCDGMSHAQRTLNIVHRDIKPANCMVTEAGTLKITDFGLARSMESDLENADLDVLVGSIPSDFTTPLGTQSYLAPEQSRGGEKLTFQTDIYSFGIMLFEVLTAYRPTHGSVAKQGMMAWPSAQELPKSLFDLLLCCVDHDVSRRPADFLEVRKTLEEIYRRHTGRIPRATAALPPPMTRREWQNKGVAFQTLELFDKALECYNHALALDPRNGSLFKGKAGALLNLRQLREALECCDRGLRFAPEDSGLWNNRGLAMFRLGHAEGALSCFEKALRWGSNDPLIWRNRGEVLHLLGRPVEALASYDRALSIDSRDSGTLELKGFALLSLERYRDALTAFNDGIALAPRQLGLWKGKGIALQNLEKYAEAVVCYDRAIEIDPADSELYRFKAQASNSVGDPKPALAAAEHGLRLNPQDPELWKSKGVALFLLTETQAALEAFLAGQRLAPRDGEFYKDIGGALVECRQFREALQWLNRGLELTPDDPYLLRNEGLAHYYLGEHERAIASFDRGLLLLPEDLAMQKGRELAFAALQEAKAKTAPTILLNMDRNPRSQRR